MPRINADNIAEHIANQRAAGLDAAVRLFVKDGYHNVTIGDIASAIGLARNSLYRYVPDKAQFLVDWYARTVPRTIDEWRAATSGPGTATERLHRWALSYLAWARTPEHALVQPLIEALPRLDADTRHHVSAQHAAMMRIVADTVAEAGILPDEVPGTVDLLAGLVLGAARAQTDETDPALRRRLLGAITAIAQPSAEHEA